MISCSETLEIPRVRPPVPLHPLPKTRSPAISAKVFVGNLNFRTTKEELTTLLSEVGEVVDVYLPADRATGRPRGFAFVEFASEDEANEAISRFHEHELAGRRLNVNRAEDRPPRRGPSGPRAPSLPPGGGPPDFQAWQGGWGGGQPGGGDRSNSGGGKPFRSKGSRRGLRGKKRSL